MSYDYLIYAVGSQVNDFGLQGVRKFCNFIKEIDDVRLIKKRILNCFELASLPTTSEEARKRLLSFVIVGAGPTGVEFCGELTDFIKQDLSSVYPLLAQYIQVILLNAGSQILMAFDEVLQQKALNSLKYRGIDIRLNSRVVNIDFDCLTYVTNNSTVTSISPLLSPATMASSTEITVELPYGLCVWAAGNSPRPITKLVASRLGAHQVESVRRTGRLMVDKWLRVASNLTEVNSAAIHDQSKKNRNIFAIGDVALTSESDDGVLPQTAQVAAQQGLQRLFLPFIVRR